MKVYKNLFPDIYSFNNLLTAYKKAKKSSKTNNENSEYFLNLEKELLQLSYELKNNLYSPSPYRYFKIYEPKERIISVAKFKDRVVHHAIVNILEPVYEKTFIYHSYATRKNKGTHKAIYQAQKCFKQNKWFLKSDIKKYFDNINHKILIDIISKKIYDTNLINLLQKIISNGGQNGTGLPIGNLTSQFFANVYLNKFDYFVKNELKRKCYLRYMDDFVIFSNNKNDLIQDLKLIRIYLYNNLNLVLKEKATFINQQLNGLSFLGTRIYPNIIRVKNENLRRISKKINEKLYLYKTNKISEEKLIETINSYNSYLTNFDTNKVKRVIFALKGI